METTSTWHSGFRPRPFEYLGYALFFAMLVFQGVAELQPVKYLLLALVLFAILIKGLKTRAFGISRQLFICTLAFVAVSLFFAARGAAAGTAGAVAALRVYAVWPLVYLLLVQELSREAIFRKLETTMSLALIFISLYGINYILAMLGFMPLVHEFDFESSEAIYGIQDGYLKMESIGFNSLPFLVPYLFCVWANGIFNRERTSRLTLAALFLGLLVVLLSGRRAILLVTLAAPFLLVAFKVWAGQLDARRLVALSVKALLPLALAGCALFMVLSSFTDISADGLLKLFVSGFDFADPADHGAYLRKEQFAALWDGWVQQPLLGAGHGAANNESIRNVQQPWAYELYYLALLFQTGLVGLLCYLGAVAWIYASGLRLVRREPESGRILFSMLVGMSCFLIASATNPYLPTFEGLWTVFLPIAWINFRLVRQASSPAGEGGDGPSATPGSTAEVEHRSDAPDSSGAPPPSPQRDGAAVPPPLQGEGRGEDGVCAVIVCYQGAATVRSTVRALAGQVGEIVIVDNGSARETSEILRELEAEGVRVICNGANLGVAHALNRGVRYARERGFTWLLTMDQDSRADTGMVAELLACARRFPDPSYVSFAPVFLPSDGAGAVGGATGDDLPDQERHAVITSGNLVRLSVFHAVGTFLDELFIDGVDLEFCLRLRQNGYRVVRTPRARLFHALGERTSCRLLGFEIPATRHSGPRRYYIMRNHLYLVRKYWRSFPLYCLRKQLTVNGLVLQVIFLEPDKGENLRYLWKGFRDGMRGRLGALPESAKAAGK